MYCIHELIPKRNTKRFSFVRGPNDDPDDFLIHQHPAFNLPAAVTMDGNLERNVIVVQDQENVFCVARNIGIHEVGLYDVRIRIRLINLQDVEQRTRLIVSIQKNNTMTHRSR
jgi:hypothetical protein